MNVLVYLPRVVETDTGLFFWNREENILKFKRNHKMYLIQVYNDIIIYAYEN